MVTKNTRVGSEDTEMLVELQMNELKFSKIQTVLTNQTSVLSRRFY